ncbi:MAG: molybdopterin molybdotransferase MoeA, partial [Sphingomonas bacterium]|nr:molybdopterin molybdotransferase MoeA [Sphingomonas bacterium]
MALITLDDAWAIIAHAADPLPAETISIGDSAGRVLAMPVVAAFESPRADVSTMDGYAVTDGDAVAGALLRVTGTSAAGARFGGAVGEGEAVRIFTGAALPDGTDRVVMQEIVEANGDRASIVEAPGAVHFTRAKASDFGAGDEVVAAGTLLSAGALVAAAGAGAVEVSVTRRPRVVTLATGDELRPIGAALDDPDHIPDSLGLGIAAMLGAIGAEVLGHHLLGDDLTALEAAAAKAVAGADLVVVTGGASVGARDSAKAMFAPLGIELLFTKVAIKPGKPVWLGRVGETLVMGLPGNPSSAMVTARLLLAPLIAGLLGQRAPAPIEWIDLPLATPLPATGDRETFVRAILVDRRLVPLANQDSGGARARGAARGGGGGGGG